MPYFHQIIYILLFEFWLALFLIKSSCCALLFCNSLMVPNRKIVPPDVYLDVPNSSLFHKINKWLDFLGNLVHVSVTFGLKLRLLPV